MKCPIQMKDGVDLILDYCSGRLHQDRPETALAFEQHLGGCQECTRVVEAQRSVWHALDRFEAPEVSADFDERLWKRIEDSEARPWWRKLLDGPALGWSGMVSWKPAFVTASACAAVFAVMLAVRPPVAPPVVNDGSSIVAPASAASVDFDQLEKALDDIEMLNQMGVMDDKDPA